MPVMPDSSNRIVHLGLGLHSAHISTDRLELEPLRREHAEELYAVLADISLYEHTRDAAPASVEALHTRYSFLEARSSPDGAELWLNWALREISTGMPIGYIQATVRSRRADLAWVVGTAWQRRGFATEAALALMVWLRCAGVTAFRARIHPMHTASQRVAERIGLARTTETEDGEDVWVGGAQCQPES